MKAPTTRERKRNKGQEPPKAGQNMPLFAHFVEASKRTPQLYTCTIARGECNKCDLTVVPIFLIHKS